MKLTIENLPIIFLIILGIGMLIIVISIMNLASIKEEDTAPEGYTHEMRELFSYFLQEEEEKNNKMRKEIGEQLQNNRHKEGKKVKQEFLEKKSMETPIFEEVVNRAARGEEAKNIAKELGRGIGEINLIISLNAMRDKCEED